MKEIYQQLIDFLKTIPGEESKQLIEKAEAIKDKLEY
jgi:hypothetical protein